MNAPPKTHLLETEFLRLVQIMDDLRSLCPWDKKQTIQSLRYLTIEEVYELSENIVSENYPEIKNELGDILLHILFYSRIASENQHFTLTEVIEGICEKLIRRHPHVYGSVQAHDEDEVKRNWETIKQAENNGEKTILSGVPSTLPALIKAIRIQEKARGAGFDWEHKSQVWQKVQEEISEFQYEESQNEPDVDKMELEFGDLLFSLVNYARFVGINPEDALEKTNKKFIKRFTFMENEVKNDGKKLENMTLDQMDVYWNKAKSMS
ncbi:MAG: nucleoside triphosphate pyrophosphohydrolase [Cytophagales bacterium]|nr:nucleoside triphosphate pyrophosphohydrolase [Cytophagales bacterium]